MILTIFCILVLAFGFVVFFGAPYVPSHKKEIRGAFTHLYAVSKDDTIIDIGSGDGVVLREAARLGATGVGYELNPILVAISKVISPRKQTTVHLMNFWNAQLPLETTLVYMFGVTRDQSKFIAKMQAEATRLNHPLKVMTYGSGLDGQMEQKSYRGHRLYEIVPLQEKKA